MNTSITFRPLDLVTWPPDQKRHRRNSQFKTGYTKVIAQVRDELRRIGVCQAVLELDITENEIRLDGMPYANAKPRTPRVRLSFELEGVGPLQYPCDTFTRFDDNLRAIGLTLEAQRSMDRYGATRRSQQYTGWKALPGGDTLQPAMTSDDAAALIVTMAGGDTGEILQDPEIFKRQYRRAVKVCHPDRWGPDFTKDFQRLQEAKRVLDTYHGAGS